MKRKITQWLLPLLLCALVGVAGAVMGVSEHARGIATQYWYGFTSGVKSSYYLSFPTLSANDEAVGKAASQTLTNKTLTSPAIDGAPTTTVGVGAKNGATVAAAEYGEGLVHKTVLTLTATPITIADDANVAQYGGVKIYDFPEGVVVTLGAVIDAACTLGATGTITNTWAGGVALGTATATTGATLTGTEADIVPEVDVAAATTKVAAIDAAPVATALTESGARWFNGSGMAKDLYLNLVVDDSATHTAGTGTITGTVTIWWINLGDY